MDDTFQIQQQMILPDTVSYGTPTIPAQGILSIAFLLVATIVILVSVVLHYHWMHYGLKSKGVLTARVVHGLVVLVSLIVMLGSLYYYGATP